MQSSTGNLEAIIRSARVLIVDDEFNMRKAIRTLLLSVGVTNVQDAADGPEGLDAIRALEPDAVILDWQMAGMNGCEFVKRVRSPATFPYPNVPIIMLTAHGEPSRVIEAMRLGVHEFLLKPVSGKALHARLASVLLKPRPMAKSDDYCGPEPRRLASNRPEAESDAPHLDPAAPGDLPTTPQGQPPLQPVIDLTSDDVIFVN